jgi:hypothetical protein
MAHVKDALDTFQKWGTGSKDIKRALEGELESLQQLHAWFVRVNDEAGSKKAIAAQQETNKTLEDAKTKAKEEADALKEVLAGVAKLHAGMSTLGPQIQATFNPDILDHFNAALKAIGNVPTVKPLYGGTTEAQELYKLLTDQNAAIAAGQKVFTQTRTAAERYKQTIAELNVLLAQGKITEDTYNRAKLEAQTRANTLGAAFKSLGQDIGQTINQAALFGGSWSDALKSIGLQIGELIIKLLFMKSLTKEAAGGGIGGFFASIASGLSGGGLPGKAGGGDINAGAAHWVGERGPEIFVPKVPGKIIPNHAITAGSPGPSVNNYAVTLNVQTPNADSFGKSQSQLLHSARQHLAGRGGRL